MDIKDKFDQTLNKLIDEKSNNDYINDDEF